MVRLESKDVDSVLQLLEDIHNLIKIYFLYQIY